MVVRPAKPDEADLLSALAKRSKAHWGYSSAFMRACREELTWSPEHIASQAYSFAVGELEGQVVGFYALAATSSEEVELEALFVEPARIGIGVGRTLMEHAKSAATRLGGKVLLVQSDPHAERFYYAAGGQLIGRRASLSIPGRLLPVFAIALGVANA